MGGWSWKVLYAIGLQLIVATVAYLWVRSANQAILRADRAETIALLQQAISEQKQRRQ